MVTMLNMQLSQSPLLKELSLDEVRYSMVWEDPILLNAALEVHSADHVLSIGSAGCNALHLLLSNPQSVTALDLSPAQCALINLKKVAISKLDHTDFTNLIGFGENRVAWSIYMSLRSELSESDRFFFDQRASQFEKGLSFQGRLEQYFAFFRENILKQIWKPDFMKALLRATTLEEQTALLKEHGNMDLLQKAVALHFGREGLTKGRSETQMKYVTRENIGEKLFAQFSQTLATNLITENHFLHLFLVGKPAADDFRPAIYQAANFSHLQSQIDKLQVVNSDLESFLQNSPQDFSKMNLSDIFEYLSPDHTAQLFKKLADKMPAGGRLAYWTLLVDRHAPNFFQPIDGLELPADRLWFYDRFFALEKAWLS